MRIVESAEQLMADPSCETMRSIRKNLRDAGRGENRKRQKWRVGGAVSTNERQVKNKIKSGDVEMLH